MNAFLSSFEFQRAKKVFDPSDIVEVPRKRGRPVGTSKKNRELRLSNNFATTPERSKSPYSINVPSPSAHHLSSDLSRCILCKYYTVIVNGVTSKMLVCSECNKNGNYLLLNLENIFIYSLFAFDWLYNILFYFLRQFTLNAWALIKRFFHVYQNRNGNVQIAGRVVSANWSKIRYQISHF